MVATRTLDGSERAIRATESDDGWKVSAGPKNPAAFTALKSVAASSAEAVS